MTVMRMRVAIAFIECQNNSIQLILEFFFSNFLLYRMNEFYRNRISTEVKYCCRKWSAWRSRWAGCCRRRSRLGPSLIPTSDRSSTRRFVSHHILFWFSKKDCYFQKKMVTMHGSGDLNSSNWEWTPDCENLYEVCFLIFYRQSFQFIIVQLENGLNWEDLPNGHSFWNLMAPKANSKGKMNAKIRLVSYVSLRNLMRKTDYIISEKQICRIRFAIYWSFLLNFHEILSNHWSIIVMFIRDLNRNG